MKLAKGMNQNEKRGVNFLVVMPESQRRVNARMLQQAKIAKRESRKNLFAPNRKMKFEAQADAWLRSLHSL